MARFEALARQLRSERIFSVPGTPADFGVEAIERMLPHRDPMRLIDLVDAFDLDAGVIRGRRTLRVDDRVFAGHFPGEPIYPGVLQLEMIGQLGLCLASLCANQGRVDASTRPVEARVVELHHAKWLQPLHPGDSLVLEARAVDSNALTGIVAGQVWREETLASICILEVYFV